VLTSKIPWDVSEYEISPDGSKLAFVTNEAGLSKM
jgi:Tol biopolymer transport system component